MLDARARLLRAALGFALMPPTEPQLRLLHRWLDSWSGVGHVVAGMARQGWDLQLTEYDAERWRATFFVASQAHSIVGGTAWETTPWRAVQRAAWEVLNKGDTQDAQTLVEDECGADQGRHRRVW
jgi:hypothetical protein